MIYYLKLDPTPDCCYQRKSNPSTFHLSLLICAQAGNEVGVYSVQEMPCRVGRLFAMQKGSWGKRTRCLSGLCTAARTTARLPTMSSAPEWRPALAPHRYTPCVVFLLSRMDRWTLLSGKMSAAQFVYILHTHLLPCLLSGGGIKVI